MCIRDRLQRGEHGRRAVVRKHDDARVRKPRLGNTRRGRDARAVAAAMLEGMEL